MTIIKQALAIAESSTTNGTGAIALGGVVNISVGNSIFTSRTVSSFLANGEGSFFYIRDGDNSRWMSFYATFVSASNALTIVEVLDSSNADKSALSLSANTHTISLDVTPGESGGMMDFREQALKRAVFQNYFESLNKPAIISGVVTLDLSLANTFLIDWTADITSVVVTGISLADTSRSFSVKFKTDATGGYTFSGWDSQIQWPGDTPSPVSTASYRSLYGFTTEDGRTGAGCWDGIESGIYVA